ncbi:MAG: response regulator [Gemmatimonadetes bacterium]|nr:response regulator [Gemmatimonadota bacterium]
MGSEKRTEGKAPTLRVQAESSSEASVRINESLDLRPLIDTLPVGIVVIDVVTGTLATINQEASRLAGDLLTPGQSMGHFLKTTSVRRGDGRMLSLEEHPVARAASTGETIRAEEVVFQVPDGRRVSVLMNATPFVSGEGGVETLVVTLQDLTPLEDLVRRRGDFAVDADRPTRGREPTTILVVDDDPQSLRNVRDVLTSQGYRACVTGNPREIPGLLEKHRPSLVVLDLVLPGTDGVDVMTEVIADAELPVIFLSAYAHEDAIARALDAGAADYVVKPFSPTELSARIRAALRQRREREDPVPEDPFVLGDLRIDYNRREVTIAGRPIRLTRLEYRLMVELSSNAGRLRTSGDLLRRVWDTLDSGDTRRLRTTVKKIRRKLGDDANNPTYILNQPGEGYRLGDIEDVDVET